jgi:hypothetical protein
MKPKKYPTNCMSPGTDSNMYQKVSSNTKSNVPIILRDRNSPLRRVQSSGFLLGETEHGAKGMPKKTGDRFFTTKLKSHRAMLRLAQYVQN